MANILTTTQESGGASSLISSNTLENSSLRKSWERNGCRNYFGGEGTGKSKYAINSFMLLSSSILIDNIISLCLKIITCEKNIKSPTLPRSYSGEKLAGQHNYLNTTSMFIHTFNNFALSIYFIHSYCSICKPCSNQLNRA